MFPNNLFLPLKKEILVPEKKIPPKKYFLIIAPKKTNIFLVNHELLYEEMLRDPDDPDNTLRRNA